MLAEITMQLIKSTLILLAFAIALLHLTNAVPATISKEMSENSLSVSASEPSVIPTGVYVPDPTSCPAGVLPTYTNPKGGQVDCGASIASSDAIPVMFLLCALMGCIVFGVIKALV